MVVSRQGAKFRWIFDVRYGLFSSTQSF